MSTRAQIINALLWAAAIIASATLHAPTAMTFLVLPSLAVAALLFAGPQLRAKTRGQCPTDAG